MKNTVKNIVTILAIASASLASAADTAKPFMRWWIFGNSMDKPSLTYQLEYMKSAGVGGVCIVPVDGQKGDEANYIDYLSPKFMEMLKYICDEAKRLDMIVDFSMGVGWPFGGPWIPQKMTAKKLDKNFKCVPANFMVKRAAPGGGGFTANPFDPEAYRLHCAVFKDAFKVFGGEKIIRAFFNDSYEYIMANWTDNYFAEFKERRGYDFAPYMKDVLSEKSSLPEDELSRLWQDYHETLSDLLFDTISEFAKACSEMGCKSINQAHGSAGNIIDLYSIADIPETESFGASVFDIPHVRVDPEYQEWRFGRPNKIVMKFASSAAHLGGKKLVSAECCTWLANHFKATLAQIKPEIDKLFYSGINHVCYHGMPYTPKDEPFPGRMFYASVNFNQNAAFKEFLPLLNEYIRQSQSILQNTESDNDVLLYFPIHSMWKSSGGANKVVLFNVHRISEWLPRSPKFAALLKSVEDGGFRYDYVSDKLLCGLRVENGAVKSGAKAYKTILVPNVGQLPISTFRTLDALINAGAKVVFDGEIPAAATGYFDFKARNAEARKFAAAWRLKPNVAFGDPLPRLLAFGAKRERMADLGLEFIRKRGERGAVYFIANQTQKFSRGKIRVSAPARQIEYFSPLDGRRGSLEFAASPGGCEFELELLAGQSCFIFANETPKEGLQKISFPADGKAAEIAGNWRVEFLRALPEPVPASEMPAKAAIKKLSSWTEFGDANASKFCGVARYKIDFELSGAPKDRVLDLGDVRDCAKVFVNGKYLGAVWCSPFRVAVPASALKDKNTLEIEVSNGAFNRAKAFIDANEQWLKTHWLMNITYVKYNTKTKPLEPSGLLGPVRLVEK